MAQPVIQTSFNAGEWAPALNARVDLEKYHSGAALIRNFFVDYRGGATTRPGTRYVLQTRSNLTVRLIPFQASFAITYVLEFGQLGTAGYLRFFNNGAPVLEAGTSPSAATNANPGVFTDTAHGYSNGDWVLASNMVGMTQLNGNYYIIAAATTNTFTLTDLFGNPVNTTAFGVFAPGGTFRRIYTIASPYKASELALLKFTQNVNQMFITHPNYPPYLLTLNSATNWTLAPITFGTTLSAPGFTGFTTSLAAGNVNYSYIATAVDINGQESAPSNPIQPASLQDIRSVLGSITITWATIGGAVSYNIYKATPLYSAPVPGGSVYGFVGNVTGLSFYDSNVPPDFSQGPPIVENPFAGSGVQTVNVTNPGLVTPGASNITPPAVTFTGGGGSGASAVATMVTTNFTVNNGGHGFNVGDTLTFANGLVLQVASVSFGAITGAVVLSLGTTATSMPSNPTGGISTSGFGSGSLWTLGWGVQNVSVISPGTGYGTPPAVGFAFGGATATAILGTASAGNPTVCGLFQQRAIFAGPVLSPSQMNFSQPGTPFNFNISFPLQADDAIQETLTNTVLNSIKSLIPVSQGLIVLSDKGAWLVNGGSPGSAISALSIVANSEGYAGAADLPPIATPSDILYVQAKGSIVRDLAYNFYLNNYVGTDISLLSSHLFYGFTLKEWAWAEEPFKTVWAVRNDGQLLSLCFVKDQQMLAWAHSDTQGLFQSIATVPETASIGTVDAVYHVVKRTINGNVVNYIERFVELTYPSDYISSWQVDAGIGYNGAAATTFSGAQHLGGQVVTGVADGAVINFTMPVSGTFVFGPGGTTGLTGIASASVVTVGLAFLPQIQTLALDLGQPTVQGKRKKITAVTLRMLNALGLSIGRSFSTLVPMNDLVLGQIGSATNAPVTGLVSADARTIVDPQWDTPGQYCIQQPYPYPASVLGVIPEIEVGDTP